ncbi:MAG: NADP-dependent isocitrate dehydrogenase [Spirochaetes bacterium]|nr:MAG: NADP-dependent isocitrate dehydrogenase [Spirochaetota bacterium]
MAEKIIITPDGINVPDNPVIPFIEGDGIGPEIWEAAVRVFDHAVKKAYAGKRKIEWLEIYAGEKGFKVKNEWLPEETVSALKEYSVGIKGPLTTPVGGGMRSLNVTLRKKLDLYVCLRPVKHYPGIPAPVVNPDAVDMVIFRENTEDVYAGLELQSGSKEAAELISHLKDTLGWEIPSDSGVGLKPIGERGSKRLIRAALNYAVEHKRKIVTLVHKGNIMKFTEGAFRNWGYELAKEEFKDVVVFEREADGSIPEGRILVDDVIADAFFEKMLTRPHEIDVIATMNLNGDYISDALAAQVGGIGIAPGGNLNYTEGTAVFEATHGTAPTIAGLGKANPSSLILSGKLMFEYLGWNEAAALIEEGIKAAIMSKKVTFDFYRMMKESELVSTGEFADQIINNMN